MVVAAEQQRDAAAQDTGVASELLQPRVDVPEHDQLEEGDLVEHQPADVAHLHAALRKELFARHLALGGAELLDPRRRFALDRKVEQREQRGPAKRRRRHTSVRAHEQVAAGRRDKLDVERVHHRRLPGSARPHDRGDAIDACCDDGRIDLRRRRAARLHARTQPGVLQKAAAAAALLRVEWRLPDLLTRVAARLPRSSDGVVLGVGHRVKRARCGERRASLGGGGARTHTMGGRAHGHLRCSAVPALHVPRWQRLSQRLIDALRVALHAVDRAPQPAQSRARSGRTAGRGGQLLSEAVGKLLDRPRLGQPRRD
eukprot:2629898-Prymnesium_polylepis.1